MPLLVHCPNRCQIRVPANRMGKVIRCVDCQTPIIIPEVESPLLRTGNWVECRAKRAIKKTEVADTDTTGFLQPTPDSAQITIPATDSTSVTPVAASTDLPPVSKLPLVSPTRTVRLLRAKPWRTVEPLTKVDPEDVLTPIDLDNELMPAELSTDQPVTSKDLEQTEEHFPDTDPRRSNNPSLVSKLIWFVNPFA